jgi:DNA-binding transcriptional LysR family regulator
LRLFDRAARGVAITQAGKLIVERARRVLFEANRLVRDAELLKTHEAGEVRIGLGPYPAMVLLPDLLVEFAHRHPRVEIKLELNHADAMIDMLLTEQIDFLVMDRRVLPDNPALAIRSLPRHDGAWFVRPGHPLVGRETLSASALREFPLVSVTLPPFMQSAVHRLLKIRSHEKIPLQLECNDVQVLKSFVEQTDALLFATASTVRKELAAGTLAPLPVKDAPRMALEIALVRLADRTMSPAGDVAVTLAEQMLKDANTVAAEFLRNPSAAR